MYGIKIIELMTGHDWNPGTPSPELVLLTPGSPASPGQALNQPAFQSKAKKSFFHPPIMYAHSDPGMEAFLFLAG